MREIQHATRHRRTKLVGIALGFGALAALAALAVTSLSHGGVLPQSTSLAGSGDAPANTTYSQPVVAGMNMGATATWAPPASTEATSKAVPPIKAAG